MKFISHSLKINNVIAHRDSNIFHSHFTEIPIEKAEESKDFSPSIEEDKMSSNSDEIKEAQEEYSPKNDNKEEEMQKESDEVKEEVPVEEIVPPIKRVKDTDDESIGETVKLGSDTDNESISSSVKSENNLVIDEDCSVTIKNRAFRDSDSEVIVVDPNAQEDSSSISDPEQTPQFMSPMQEDCRFFNQPSDEYYINFKEYIESIEREFEGRILKIQDSEVAEEEMAMQIQSTSMAPPLKKFKHSVSPLAGFVIETPNVNDGILKEEPDDVHEDVIISTMNKKRKMCKAKKLSTGSTSSHSSINGDSYDNTPSSPQSDISASSDKTTGPRDDKK